MTKKWHLDPQSDSKLTLGVKKVTFRSLLSLFTKRGKSLFVVSFVSNYIFSHFGSAAGRGCHKLRKKI